MEALPEDVTGRGRHIKANEMEGVLSFGGYLSPYAPKVVPLQSLKRAASTSNDGDASAQPVVAIST